VAAPTRAHTADLSDADLRALRGFLDEAFEGDFTDDDWEHALGGVHVLAHAEHELVGHASVVQRRLVLGSRALRTGYVEAVAVRSDCRNRGLGAEIMKVVGDLVRNAYDLGALGAGERAARLYARHGWLRWAGPTWTLSPDGPVRTEDDDGSVYVLPTPTSPDLDLSEPIACDWRPGDVW
jgi:aminoglycoside 2'-N-acetyltransferase I